MKNVTAIINMELGLIFNLFGGFAQSGPGSQRAEGQGGGQQGGEQQQMGAGAELGGYGVRRGNAEDQHRRRER